MKIIKKIICVIIIIINVSRHRRECHHQSLHMWKDLGGVLTTVTRITQKEKVWTVQS